MYHSFSEGRTHRAPEFLAIVAAFDGVGVQRTVVVTPQYVLDVMQMASAVGERMLALPWHGCGRVTPDHLGLTFERGDGVLRVCLAGRPVSFIKADVEGMEMELLRGAERTIRA